MHYPLALYTIVVFSYVNFAYYTLWWHRVAPRWQPPSQHTNTHTVVALPRKTGATRHSNKYVHIVCNGCNARVTRSHLRILHAYTRAYIYMCTCVRVYAINSGYANVCIKSMVQRGIA